MYLKKLKLLIYKIEDRVYSILPDNLFYQVRYFRSHGRFCDFKNPQRFSEKIFYRMRYPLPIFSTLADRVEMRNVISEKLNAKYLVPLYFFTDVVTEETFDRLPSSFVMKANNSAGEVKVVLDKSSENIPYLVALANSWLESDFSYFGREKHYGKIKPQIIFEHALVNGGHSPDDYKVNVFNTLNASDSYIFIQHMQNRQGSMTQDIYSEEWDVAPFCRKGESKGAKGGGKPKLLEEMINISKELSSGFGYVRVDFYLHNEQVYIGEITMTPAAGTYRFEPKEWDEILGRKFDLLEYFN